MASGTRSDLISKHCFVSFSMLYLHSFLLYASNILTCEPEIANSVISRKSCKYLKHYYFIGLAYEHLQLLLALSSYYYCVHDSTLVLFVLIFFLVSTILDHQRLRWCFGLTHCGSVNRL